MKQHKLNIQMATREVIYAPEGLPFRIRLEKFWDDFDGWSDWFIDTQHEVDKFKEIISEDNVKTILQCFKNAKKRFP